MNKQRHRLVFNARRCQIMAVAESASSVGGAATSERTASGAPVIRPSARSLRRMALHPLAMSIGGALILALAFGAGAQAQIIADPQAPANQRATVHSAPNGVPLVNIQTPTAAGVSRNAYRQFDVQSNGAILNNSRTQVQTQLGGWVQGNPWLAAGPARIIVNEVNSSNPSLINGYVEVAGQRAQVIIANPSGIQVQGGGFINASKATLTTGQPVWSGGDLEAFRVQGGTIRIDGAGLDTSSADYTAILARAVQVNAGIWAQDLKLVTGANHIGADMGSTVGSPSDANGTAPAYALDVAQLGGMYARKIQLIGTEAGVGVNLRGVVGATAGDVVVDASGWLRQDGTLQAEGQVRVSAKADVLNTGEIYATTAVSMISSQTLTNQGQVQANGAVDLQATNISNQTGARVASSTDASAEAIEVLSNEGEVAAGGQLHVRADTVNNTDGQLQARRIDLETRSLDNTKGVIWQSGVQSLGLDLGRFDNTRGQVGTRQLQVTDSGGSSPGSASGDADHGAPVGSGPASGGSDSPGSSAIPLADGAIRVLESTRNLEGVIAAEGPIDVSVNNGLVNSGSMDIDRIDVRGGELNNDGGRISTREAHFVVSTSSNTDGKIEANDLQLSTGAFANTRGQLNTLNELRITATGMLDNALGHVQSMHGNVQIEAAGLHNSGEMRAARDLNVVVAGDLVNLGALAAAGNTSIVARSVDSTGMLASGLKADGNMDVAGNLQIETSHSLRSSGLSLSAGDAAVTGSTIDLSAGRIGGQNISLLATTGDIDTSAATVVARETLKVRANAALLQTLNNSGGAIYAEKLDVQVSNLSNVNGSLAQTGNAATVIALQSAESAVPTGTLDNRGGTIHTNGEDFTLQAIRVDNQQGKVLHAGDGNFDISTAAQLDNAHGTLQSSARNFALQTGDFANQQGQVVHTGIGEFHVSAQTGLDNAGGSLQTHGTNGLIQGGSINNQSARILHAGTGDLLITAQANLDNTAGVIHSDGRNLSLQGDDVLNRQGQLAHSGVGELKVRATSLLDNSSGTVQSNGEAVALQARSIDNHDGRILHAGTNSLTLEAQALTDNTAGIIHTDADHLSIRTDSLTNQQGRIVHAGQGGLQLSAEHAVNNSAGEIHTLATNVSVNAGSVANEAGAIIHAGRGSLQVTAKAELSNSDGTIQTNGKDLMLRAQRMDNQRGQIVHAGEDTLQVTVQEILNNASGNIQTNAKDVGVQAGSLLNQSGQLTHAGQGEMVVTTQASLNNAAGVIHSQAKDVAIRAASLDNRGGGIVHDGLGSLGVTADTLLDNQGGRLLTNASLNVQAGQLDNRMRGRMAAVAAATVRTQSGLDNSGGEIAALGDLQIQGVDIANVAGQVAGGAGVEVQAVNFDNSSGGLLQATGDVRIGFQRLDNSGGRLQSMGNLTAEAVGPAAVLVNRQGLIHSAGSTQLIAHQIDNSETHQDSQGIHGSHVLLMADTLNNLGGHAVADENLDIRSAGTINNAQGLLSAGGTVSLLDPALAGGGSSTLAISNTGGTIVADELLVLGAAKVGLDGNIVSQKDIELQFSGDHHLAQGAELIANRNLTLILANGDLTNDGSLKAGEQLLAQAQDIRNGPTGTISAATTLLRASGMLTNEGLIDGTTTDLRARSLTNTGNGRIYGEKVLLQTSDGLLNQGDAVIAAHDSLQMGVGGTLVNRAGASLLSLDELAVGGALDANGMSTGAAQAIENRSAAIESMGDMQLSAVQIKNLNDELSYRILNEQPTQRTDYYTPLGYIGSEDVAWTAPMLIYTDGTRSIYYPNRTDLLLNSSPYAPAEFRGYFLGQDPYVAEHYAPTGLDSTKFVPDQFNYARSSPIWAALGMQSPAWDAPGGRPQPRELPNTTLPPDPAQVERWEAAAEPWFELQRRIDALRPAIQSQLLSYDLYRSYTESTSTAEVTGSKPGKIVSGGNLRFQMGGTLLNQDSSVLAGGSVQVEGGSVQNQSTVVSIPTQRSGTFNNWAVVGRDCDLFGCDPVYGWASSAYAETIQRSMALGSVRFEQGVQAQGSGMQPGVFHAGQTSISAAGAGSVTPAAVAPIGSTIQPPAASPAPGSFGGAEGSILVGAVGSTFVAPPPATVASGAQPQAAPIPPPPGHGDQSVRIGAPNVTLPTSALFQLHPGSASNYLVETDPRFTDHRQWLSSDYMLAALSVDPATVQKRLGDGFYEQRLVREQVASLTGNRYLGDYTNDEQQYRELMNSGATFAQAHQLRPGIALSAAQVATLTSDIVWLVERTVSLPDGTTTQALVPQLYVRPQAGDLQPSGALLAGRNVNLNLSGDLTNASGTIAGRQVTQINAQNVHNLGGLIGGGEITAVHTTEDIRNIGGAISAQDALILDAGRDLSVQTTTAQGSGQAGVGVYSSQGIDRVAALYVSNPNGVLLASAGRDVNLTAALVQSEGGMQIEAGRDLILGTVQVRTDIAVQRDERNYAGVRQSEEVGTRITSRGNTSLIAGRDIDTRAAQVQAQGQLGLQAGRDVNIEAGQQSLATDNASYAKGRGFLSSGSTEVREHRSETNAVASNLGGEQVTIQSGQDTTVQASSVAGDQRVTVSAGRDVNVLAGRASSESLSATHSSKSGALSRKSNTTQASSSSDLAVGSSIDAQSVEITAGQDIAVKGSSVNAQDLLLLDAGRDIAITSEQNHESGSYFHEAKKSGFTVSKEGLGYGKSAHDQSTSSASTTQAGSTASGGDVLLFSGRDTRIEASTVVADDMLGIDAGGDVSIVSGVNTETSGQTSNDKSKGINLVASGLTESVTIMHDTRQSGDGTGTSATAAASTVGSLGGDVTITAAQKYQQTGSDVLALEGDIDIQARQVEITESREARSTTSQQSSKSTVLGATPRNALVDAIQGVKSTSETALAATQTGNSRAQALGAAATALSVYNTANQVADLIANPDKIASVTVDFNLSSSKSQSQSAETADSGRASAVAAAGDVRMTAKGAGDGSDLLVRGSDVSAGNNATLKAEGDVQLKSSQDHSTLHSTSSSSGASIGVGVSFGASNGITFNASANKARGNADGEDVVQRNTHIVAGNTARIESGADTTLAGATVSANTVQAEVGGDLNIESRQDTGQFKSDQSSSGWGVSLCIPPFCYGASSVSISGGAQNIESEFASVIEQSGIRAGDGGFQVNVQGDTTLTGGAITSTDQAVQDDRNRFATGGDLTLTDVQNHAEFKGDGYSVNMTVAGGGPDPQTLTPEQKALAPATAAKNAGSAGIGEDSGSASSTTEAAISGIAGNTQARTGDAEAGIAPIFDRERVQREIDAHVKISAEFGKQASQAIGDYSTKQMKEAGKLREQASTEPNPIRKADLIAQADLLESNWGDSGTLRLLAHTTIGALTGGAAGAAGAAAGTLSAPIVANALNEAGVQGPLADLITAAASVTVGAGVGGTAGATAAYNEVQNNFLTHAEASRRLKLQGELLACSDAACRQEKQTEIDRLNRLDSWRDQQIDLACKSPSSAACQSWTAAIQVASKSYEGQIGNLVDKAERASVQNQAFKYQQAVNNPFMHGVGKGLLKLTPPGLLIGAAGGVAMTVQAIAENGLSQTLIDGVNAIADLPADLKARLNSPDPTVRGEALVDVITLGSGAAAVVAGGTKVTINAVQRAQVAKVVADAEASAVAKAKIDNNFFADGSSSTPVGLQTSAGVLSPNPNKTTTVLGRWRNDMESVIDGQMQPPKTEDFGARPGGFNVLNVSKATEEAAGQEFFERINKPFLDEAVARGDDVVLATIPQTKKQIIDPVSEELIGNYAKELDYLVRRDYRPVNVSSEKWAEIKGWFK